MDKRKMLFEQLSLIKDYWVNTATESLQRNADLMWSDVEDAYHLLQSTLCSEAEKDAFKRVVNEIIKGAIHSILVMVDGGDDLADKFRIDIIDEGTKDSLKSSISLHEEFFSYLLEIEEE